MENIVFEVTEIEDGLLKVFVDSTVLKKYNCIIPKEKLFKTMNNISFELNNIYSLGCVFAMA